MTYYRKAESAKYKNLTLTSHTHTQKSFMNINPKSHNKCWLNKIQPYIRRVIYPCSTATYLNNELSTFNNHINILSPRNPGSDLSGTHIHCSFCSTQAVECNPVSKSANFLVIPALLTSQFPIRKRRVRRWLFLNT